MPAKRTNSSSQTANLRGTYLRSKRKHLLAPERLTPTSKSQTEYQYEPLDLNSLQIRLFHLDPGNRNDPLRGHFSLANLFSAPQYDAISYVWGDPKRAHIIFVSHSAQLGITDNLRKALENIRHIAEPIILWIDAICIDQESIEERNHQVNFMSSIYGEARIVRVWLDVDVDLAAKPFQMIKRLKAGENYNDIFINGTGSRSLRETVVLEDYDQAFWEPLYRILGNVYWKRVSTQQEFYLARNIQLHLPNGTLDPDLLLRFEYASRQSYYNSRALGSNRAPIWTLFPSLFDGLQGVRTGLRSHWLESPETNLIQLFFNTDSLETSDPRDRVYGIMGLARDCSKHTVRPDYNNTILETYLAVIQHFISEYQCLDFLCYKSAIVDHTMPTWLPAPSKKSSLRVCWLKMARRLTSPFAIDLDSVILKDGTLSIHGFKHDEITEIGPRNLTRLPIVTWTSGIETMYARLGISLSVSQSSTILDSDLFYELLAFGFDEKDRHQATDKQLQKIITELLKTLLPPNCPAFSLYNVAFPLSLVGKPDMDNSIEFSTEHRQVARMLSKSLRKSGFIGTGAKKLGIYHPSCPEVATEVGDEVWVVPGCAMPLILRPKREEHSCTYRLIGPAVLPHLFQFELFSSEQFSCISDNAFHRLDYNGPKTQLITLI